MENGKDHGPLAGWVIALAGGKYIIGRPRLRVDKEAAMVLQPAYEIEMTMIPVNTPNGPQPMPARNVQWILNNPLIRQLEFPSAVPTIPLEDFPMKERQDMANVLDQMEKNAAAARAGIVIAPAGSLPKQQLPRG